jgi:hypothetical protein
MSYLRNVGEESEFEVVDGHSRNCVHLRVMLNGFDVSSISIPRKDLGAVAKELERHSTEKTEEVKQ